MNSMIRLVSFLPELVGPVLDLESGHRGVINSVPKQATFYSTEESFTPYLNSSILKNMGVLYSVPKQQHSTAKRSPLLRT